MTGDEVKKLDVLSNSLVINMLQSSYSTCVLVSEENKEAVITAKDKRVRKGGGVQFCPSPLDGDTELRRWLPCISFVSAIFLYCLISFSGNNCILLYLEVLRCQVKKDSISSRAVIHSGNKSE